MRAFAGIFDAGLFARIFDAGLFARIFDAGYAPRSPGDRGAVVSGPPTRGDPVDSVGVTVAGGAGIG